MEKQKIKAIKQECLTLATKTKHMANNFETLVYELHQITQRIDDITLKLTSIENNTPIDVEDYDLINEWIFDNGNDFDDSFFDAVETELESEMWGREATIRVERSIIDGNRDDILRMAIERYIEWAKNQKETQEEEDAA